jgi:heterodisulfide reductase subunit A-like polyferredoxin
MEKRIGVYICHCGTNIAGYLDVEKVAEYARGLPSVVVARDYMFMCSAPGQELIKQDIVELGLNRILVASCSPGLHLNTFREACQDAGLNPYQCEMTTIREHCSWVHSHEHELATEKAMALVAASVRRVLYDNPLEIKWVPINVDTLVVGAGIAGIQAAIDIASSGHKVYLVERESTIGGHMVLLNRTFPELVAASDIMDTKLEAVESSDYIELMINSEVVEVTGYIGNFKIKIKKQPDQIIEVEVGSIIVATGFEVFDPTPMTQYGYGRFDNVITSLEFEAICNSNGSTGDNILLKDGSTPKSVAIVHCVGSRDENFNEYCSRICCTYGLKYAHQVKEKTDAQVYQMYIDMRCFGKGHEEFYKRVADEGVNFIRGKVANITDVSLNEEEKGRLIVIVEDTLLGSIMRVPVDMVILSVAMEPRSDAAEVARTFLLGRSRDGFFMERHPKLDPVGTMIEGVFAVGCCQSPKDILDTVSQASGAAARALVLISRGKVQVEAATAFVDEEVCSGCGYCEAICPYLAIEIDPKRKVAFVNETLCKGCGACTVNCPSKAMQLKNFTPKQIMDMIDVATTEYAGLAS